MLHVDQPKGDACNHPLALRMAAIAFINFNITMACIWGSFSVLLSLVETRMGVGRDLSTLAVPVLNLTMAICAPIVGTLASRFSLRLVMIIGALLSLAGFILLATSSSYLLYMVAFGIFLGPGMAVGAVLPGTLTTRWYSVNRGRALGIVYAPVFIAIMSLVSNWTLHAYGLPGTYFMLAACSAVTVIANFCIVDRPPGVTGAAANDMQANAQGRSTEDGAGLMKLVSTPRFWGLSLAYIASITGSMILAAHIVPMARSWGFTATLAATLLSVQAFTGIGGTIAFGWVADRLGGALTLGILLFNSAVLLLLLLLHPPFAAVLLIFGLLGIHGAGAVPVIGIAITENFGRESFSRAYGLVNLINLPFSVTAVPAAALLYTRTGSYEAAIVCEAAFLALGCVLAFSAKKRRD
jgi:MFS family permease